MFLIVGLGNPGTKYQKTRHNFGFLTIDQIISDYNFSLIKSKSSNYELFFANIDSKKIYILKPLKYMNLSGSPILEIKKFYKIEIDNIIVMHDDLDLDFGRIKIKRGGGNSGHNGLKDIDRLIGREYLRLRLGIGRPLNQDYDISDYVLSKFNEKEFLELENININISNLLPFLISKENNLFINNFYLKSTNL
ncbi:aminoacyl-tRNA hydrolase [Rickettsiales bacterium]|nr:aminoacyl-tRNA hydrolase [Rickettsiales bacterium]